MQAEQVGGEELADGQVTVSVARQRGRTAQFTGKVVFVNPIIEANGNYRVWAEVDNRQENGHWLLAARHGGADDDRAEVAAAAPSSSQAISAPSSLTKQPPVPPSKLSSTTRKLPLRLRPDLVVRRQSYQGQASWAVKEPLGQAYFRFNAEDFALLQMLDGRSSLEEIKERFERRFPHTTITAQHVWEFIGSLHRSNLLVSSAPDQGRSLKARRDERGRKELLGKLTNVLAIRFRGVDPERVFAWLYPKVRWFFSPVAVALCCALALAALSLIVVQFDVFQRRLPAFHQFFGLKNAPWLLLALAITKIIHEFGHGLTCKHFGGECHEIGVLLLVLTPCLYCNVSDSWMLPNKWHRAAIGAAGMYVEIVLASICTFLWWFSEPGLLNYLCLYVDVRLLGQHDGLQRQPAVALRRLLHPLRLAGNPQPAAEGHRRLAAWSRLVVLGPGAARRPLPAARAAGPCSSVYGLASAVYSWLVLYLILWFLAKVLAPYRLEIFGQALAVVAVGGLVVAPLWKLGRFFECPGGGMK